MSTAAKLFFKSLDGVDESQVFRIRAKLMRNLIKLCKRQETPRPYKASTSRKRKRVSYEDEHIEDVQKPNKTHRIDDTITDFQTEGTALHCPFCRCNEEVGL